MRYRIKVIRLSNGVDLEGVQNDLDELHSTYLASEKSLGKLTDERKQTVSDSIGYAKSLVSVVQEYKDDKKGGSSRLKIA